MVRFYAEFYYIYKKKLIDVQTKLILRTNDISIEFH